MSIGAPAAISVTVSPRQAIGPVTLTVRVRVWPTPADRWVGIEVDGVDFFRQSTWEIDPSRSPQTFDALQYRDVPAGTYVVTAAVGSGNTTRAWASMEVYIH